MTTLVSAGDGASRTQMSGAGLAAEISDLVGGVASEHMGCGHRARTHVSGDVITVILEDTLTVGERRMVRDGMSELVLSTRRAFQRTMSDDLVARVAKLTGRGVRVSASEMSPDITVEVLVLEDPLAGAAVKGARLPR